MILIQRWKTNRAYSNTINLTTALHAGRRVVLKEHYGWAFNG